LAIAFIVLVARRPETISRPQFWGEDGQLLYVGTYFGDPLHRIAEPYVGYVVLVMRLVAYMERLVPLEWAPLVGNVFSLLVVVVVAGFVASRRMADQFPDVRLRIALACVLLLLPVSTEPLGALVDTHFYLGLLLLMLAVSRPPARRVWGVVDLVGAAAIGLTGPWSVIWAPLFVVRGERTRDPHAVALAVVVVGAAAVQLGAYALSGYRPPGTLPPPADLLAMLGLRGVVAPLIGPLWTSFLQQAGLPAWIGSLAIVVLSASLIVVAFTSLPRRALLVIGYVIVALTVSIALRYGDSVGVLAANPFAGERYFVVPGAIVAAIVVVGLFSSRGRARVIAQVLGVLLLLGVVSESRLRAQPDLGWPVNSECIGAADPCMVPVFPSQWTIEWPGKDGEYRPVPSTILPGAAL